MKKTSIRRLKLERETIRQLDADELGDVAGGATGRSDCICNVTDRCSLSGCPFNCRTEVPYCTMQSPCR